MISLFVFHHENGQIPLKVEWFEMDEIELLCTGWVPNLVKRMVVIDFLSTPSIKETERETSSGPLSNGDSTSWRFTLAKEINEALSLKPRGCSLKKFLVQPP